MAFPATSTGVYRYRGMEAARMAVDTLRVAGPMVGTGVATAVLVAFDERTLERYEALLA